LDDFYTKFPFKTGLGGVCVFQPYKLSFRKQEQCKIDGGDSGIFCVYGIKFNGS
jgi:hypothetical protein